MPSVESILGAPPKKKITDLLGTPPSDSKKVEDVLGQQPKPSGPVLSDKAAFYRENLDNYAAMKEAVRTGDYETDAQRELRERPEGSIRSPGRFDWLTRRLKMGMEYAGGVKDLSDEGVDYMRAEPFRRKVREGNIDGDAVDFYQQGGWDAAQNNRTGKASRQADREELKAIQAEDLETYAKLGDKMDLSESSFMGKVVKGGAQSAQPMLESIILGGSASSIPGIGPVAGKVAVGTYWQQQGAGQFMRAYLRDKDIDSLTDEQLRQMNSISQAMGVPYAAVEFAVSSIPGMKALGSSVDRQIANAVMRRVMANPTIMKKVAREGVAFGVRLAMESLLEESLQGGIDDATRQMLDKVEQGNMKALYDYDWQSIATTGLEQGIESMPAVLGITAVGGAPGAVSNIVRPDANPQAHVTTAEGRPVRIVTPRKVDDRGEPISAEQPIEQAAPTQQAAVPSPPADTAQPAKTEAVQPTPSNAATENQNAGEPGSRPAGGEQRTFVRDDGKATIQGEVVSESENFIEIRTSDAQTQKLNKRFWNPQEGNAAATEQRPATEADQAVSSAEPAVESVSEDRLTQFSKKAQSDINILNYDEKVQPLQDRIDDAIDRHLERGMSFEDASKAPDVISLYEQRFALDDQVVSDFTGKVLSAMNNIEADNEYIQFIAKDVYGAGYSELHLLHKQAVKALNNREETIKELAERIARAELRAKGQDFDGVMNPNRSGLTESGRKELLENAVRKAEKIHYKIEKQLSQTPPSPAPDTQPPSEQATATTAEPAEDLTVVNDSLTTEEQAAPAREQPISLPAVDGTKKGARSPSEKTAITTYRTIAEAIEATGATRNRIEGTRGKYTVRGEEALPAKTPSNLAELKAERDILTRIEQQDGLNAGQQRQLDYLNREIDKQVETPQKPTTDQMSFLDKLEAEARAEIETLKKGSAQGMNKPAGIAANYVVIGAVKIARGTVKFSQWAAEMVKEFGEEIRPMLRSIYEASTTVAKQNKQTPEDFRASVDSEIKRLENRNLSLMSESDDVRGVFASVDRARENLGEPAKETFEKWDAEAKKRYDENPEGAYLDVVSGKLDMSDPVNVRLAQMAMTRDMGKDMASGDTQGIERAVTAAYNVRKQGTQIARALAARRDPLQTPAERVQSLLNNLIVTPSERDTQAMGVVNDKKRMALIRKQAERAKSILDELNRNGIKIEDLGELDGMNKRKVSAALRIIQANKAGMADKEFEYWRNAILSAPTTQMANVIGNTFNSLYQYALLRPTEATINKLTGNKAKGATTFEDLGTIYKAIFSGQSWLTGWRNAVEAWTNEQPVMEGTKLEGTGVAISGTKGRIIRTPQRLLLAADEFAKGMITQIEVAAQAAMLGREQGLEGEALDSFVTEQMHDPGSVAWAKSLEEARDITFQAKVGKIANSMMQIRNADGVTGFFARHILPFIVTPTNIVKTGVRRTPLGSLVLPSTIAKSMRGEVSQQVAMSRVAEQVLAWGLTAVMYGLVNDKDEDGLPKWITGSSPPNTERGKRDFQYRNVPAQSIRIPGTDRWVSYQRIEPLATTLSVMVDTMVKDGENISNKTWVTLTGLVRDKTFMRGLSDVIDVVEKRDLNAVYDWSSNFSASYMPNILRSSLRADDDYIRQYMIEDPDNQLKDWPKRTAQRMLPHPALMPPAKVDLFGRDVKKDSVTGFPLTDFIYNATLPIRVQDKTNVENIDRFLINYNNANPDNQYWPTLPSPTYTQDGEKKRMSEDEYHQFLKLRGEYINNAQLRISPDRTTKEDRDRVSNLFTEATQYAKKKMGIQSGPAFSRRPSIQRPRRP